MKVNATEKLPVYQVLDQKLLIHWNEQIIEKESETGELLIGYEYNEARAFIYDERSQLIEKIINSVYSSGAEFAVINNKEEKPEQYAEYQAFRLKAKELADGWIAQRGQ